MSVSRTALRVSAGLLAAALLVCAQSGKRPLNHHDYDGWRAIVGQKISPDGKRMAWIAPDRKNVRQVWVKTIGKDDDKVVTDDKKRGIRMYEWAENSKVLLYMQDNDGDEDFHVYGVDLDAGKVRDFTPHEKIQARISDQHVIRTDLKAPSAAPSARSPGRAAAR